MTPTFDQIWNPTRGRSVPAGSSVRVLGMLAPSLDFRYSVRHDETDKPRHKRSKKNEGYFPLFSVKTEDQQLKTIKLFLYLPAVPMCCISILLPHQAQNVNRLKGLPPVVLSLLLCVWINVHVFGASVTHPGGTGSSTQRRQCGPLLAENTGSLLMFRPGPFQSAL